MFVILSRGLFFIETKGHLRSVTKIKEGTETTLTHQVSHPVVITPREHAALAQSPRHHYTSSLRAAPAHLLLFFSLVSSFPLAIRSFPLSSIEPAAVNTHELISSPACLMTVFTVTHAASPQTLICGSEANVSHFYTDPLTQSQFILVSKNSSTTGLLYLPVQAGGAPPMWSLVHFQLIQRTLICCLLSKV